MGTSYFFLCEACAEVWDLDKYHNAARFLPELLKEHPHHKTVVFDEDKELQLILVAGLDIASIYPNNPYTIKDCFNYEKFTSLPEATQEQIEAFFDRLSRDSEDLWSSFKRVKEVLLELNPEAKKAKETQDEEERRLLDTVKRWEEEAVGVPENLLDEEGDEQILRRALGSAYILRKEKEENP